jgi:type II secretory pathway component PulK
VITARRGVALMVVLWILVLLGGIGAAVSAQARRATDVTASARAQLAARYAAESAIVVTIDALQRELESAGDDTVRRQRILNSAESRRDTLLTLGTQRAQVAISDVSARLDVNAASVDALAQLFSRAGQPALARRTAEAIKAWIGGTGTQTRLVMSLEQVATIPGADSMTVTAALPYLTVDGDGRINRRTASPLVRAAAAGDLQNEPSRLLLVARGWQDGHPLTHEVQVVVAVQGAQLVFVRWRERDR